jgi:hypothetical protein
LKLILMSPISLQGFRCDAPVRLTVGFLLFSQIGGHLRQNASVAVVSERRKHFFKALNIRDRIPGSGCSRHAARQQIMGDGCRGRICLHSIGSHGSSIEKDSANGALWHQPCRWNSLIASEDLMICNICLECSMSRRASDTAQQEAQA